MCVWSDPGCQVPAAAQGRKCSMEGPPSCSGSSSLVNHMPVEPVSQRNIMFPLCKGAPEVRDSRLTSHTTRNSYLVFGEAQGHYYDIFDGIRRFRSHSGQIRVTFYVLKEVTFVKNRVVPGCQSSRGRQKMSNLLNSTASLLNGSKNGIYSGACMNSEGCYMLALF